MSSQPTAKQLRIEDIRREIEELREMSHRYAAEHAARADRILERLQQREDAELHSDNQYSGLR